MKKISFIIGFLICICICICVPLSAQLNGSVHLKPQDIETEQNGTYVDLSFPKSQFMDVPGSPKVPYLTRSYVIPANAKTKGIRINSVKKERLPEMYYLSPAQPPIPTGAYSVTDGFLYNESVYNSSQPYPVERVKILSDGIDQGYHIVTIAVYPVEYIPSERVVNIYSINYTLEYTTASTKSVGTENQPKQSVRRAGQIKEYIRDGVENPADVENFAPAVTLTSPVSYISSPNKIQKRSSLSVLEELVPDYIIVTNETLKPAFQKLADWKTKKGVPALIMTVEEISANYPGVDLPEKIRNFLIECYRKWGAGLFVALGGDFEIIPAKLYISIGYSDKGIKVPVDLYYATTDGNWLSPSEYISYSVNSFQGRIPVKNVLEVDNFVKKILAYEKAQTDDRSYYNNILVADAFMQGNSVTGFYDQYKDDLKNEIIYPQHLNKWFIFDDHTCSGLPQYLYYQSSLCTQGNQELNRQNVLSALSSGVNRDAGSKYSHIFYNMDHGSATALGTSSIEKNERMTREEIGQLQNGNAMQIFMTGSCNTAEFQHDCFAERYLNNTKGGGVAYIGNSDNGWTNETWQFQYFVNALYGTPGIHHVGHLFRQVQKGSSNAGGNRKIVLLGDPEMPVWSKSPRNLTVQVSGTSTTKGQVQVSVSVNGLDNGVPASISIQKGKEAYRVGIAESNGSYPFTLPSHSADSIDVTVTASDYLPYEVRIADPAHHKVNLYISELNFKDDMLGRCFGNGDGRLDAGETVELAIRIKNKGTSGSTPVTTLLSCSSPYISLIDSVFVLGPVGVDTTVSHIAKYYFRIDPETPEINKNDILSNAVQFNCILENYLEKGLTNPFNVDIHSPALEQQNKIITGTQTAGSIQPGDQVNLKVELGNWGRGDASGLTAVLTSSNPYITILSGQSAYPDIKYTGVQANSSDFKFKVSNSYTVNSPLTFTLKVTNRYGKVWNFEYDLLSRPDTIGINSIKCNPKETEIELNWDGISGAKGYIVYRSNSDDNGNDIGDYKQMNRYLLTTPSFTDYGLDICRGYFYKIKAVSQTGNESKMSQPFGVSTTYPMADLFPLTMTFGANYATGSAKVADVNHTGKKQIMLTFKDGDPNNAKGYVEVLNPDGTEMFNIDNNVTTYSGFAEYNACVSGCAIGNLYGNGQCQMIVATRDANKNLSSRNNSVSCYSFKDENNDSKPDLLWEVKTGGVCFHQEPVIANLDNSPDGSQEIVLVSDGNSTQGKILILDNNGNTLHVLEEGTISYSALSVADLDGDGDLEIIIGRSKLWGNLPACVNVYHHNGTPYGSQPFYSREKYEFKTPVVADIDNDGNKEIIITATKENDTKNYYIHVLRKDGTLMPGWGNQNIANHNDGLASELSVGDLNNDGKLEIVALGTTVVKIWNYKGELLNSIPVPYLQPTIFTPILADVDGDDDIEIIFGNRGNSDNKIHALKLNGNRVKGFPLVMKDSEVSQITLCVDDIDGDGKNELIIPCEKKVYVWKTDGRSDRIEWGNARHDCRNTGEYVKKNVDLQAKFPVTITATGVSNSLSTLKVADVDYSGKKKIFAAFRNNDILNPVGCLEVLNADGTEMFDIDRNPNTYSGFALFDTYLKEFAIGNIYGTGQCQVITTTRDASQAVRNNYISCHSFLDNNGDGKPDLLWQTQTGGVCFDRNPIIANLDNSSDRSQEIVLVTDGNSTEKKIMVLDNNGNVLHEFGADLISYSAHAVADLDNDGDMEIIVCQSKAWGTLPGCVNVYHHDGRPFGPQPFYVRDNYDFKTPVIADINGDGTKEIIVPGTKGNDGKTYNIHVLRQNGTLMPGWGRQNIVNKDNRPYTNFADLLEIAVGDLNGDGNLEVVAMGIDTIKVWNNNGVLLNSIYCKNLVSSERTPILADVDGDNEAEIVYEKYTANDIGIYAVKMDGRTVPGFPLFMFDTSSTSTLCVDDIDGDGKNEILASVLNYIYMWKTEGRSDRIEWGSARHDCRNTGEYTRLLNNWRNEQSDRSTFSENIEDGNKIYQNFPNPFSVSTEISYVISKSATHAELCIFDLWGRRIRCYSDLKTGNHTLSIPGKELKSGMYIYSLFVDGQMVDTKRMILTE